MALVTERTKGGLRLRLVVNEGIYRRLELLADQMGLEEQELLRYCIGFGISHVEGEFRRAAQMADVLTSKVAELQAVE